MLRSDGTLVAQGITWRDEWRNRLQLTLEPQKPQDGRIIDLAGNWLFLGPYFEHFGHFLTESISRIWALDQLRGQVDGAVFVRHNSRAGSGPERYNALLRALDVDIPVRLLTSPTRIERLHVPPQGLGLGQLITGAPEFRAYVRAHAGRNIAPSGSARIYISRSALAGSEGSILGEVFLEDLLRAEGYEIYHPQEHSLESQIAAYKAATHVIAPDGSPLHLLSLVGNGLQKVGVIVRRDYWPALHFAKQAKAFQGVDIEVFDHIERHWVIERDWVKPDRRGPTYRSWGEVDFRALGRSLQRSGLIKGRIPWPALSPAQVAEELARIEKAQSTTLRSYPRQPLLRAFAQKRVEAIRSRFPFRWT